MVAFEDAADYPTISAGEVIAAEDASPNLLPAPATNSADAKLGWERHRKRIIKIREEPVRGLVIGNLCPDRHA